MAAAVPVATRGYFCEDQPLGRVTRGYFCGLAVPEEISSKGGGRDRKLTEELEERKVRRRLKRVDQVHVEELLPEDVTETTKEAILKGKVDVDGVEVIVGSTPTPAAIALAPLPELKGLVGSLERVLAETERESFKLKQAQAILDFQEDVRKFEEEFLMFLLLMCE